MSGKYKYLLLLMGLALLAWYSTSTSMIMRFMYPLEYKETILAESRNFKLDPALVAAVIFEESKFNKDAVSRSGAIGLMQLMPKTANWAAENLKITFGSNDIFEPEINIKLGCWYLRFLLNKYEREDLALAAYNSGHQNVDRWMKKKNITKNYQGEIKIGYGETRHYVKNVKKSKELYRKLYWSYL